MEVQDTSLARSMRSDSRARRSDGGERVKLYNFSCSFLFFSRRQLSERLERAT